jgi:NAD(P)H-dependent FMN reductase
MQILALSGSLRAASTNTALLHAFARRAAPRAQVTVYEGLGSLPIFSPDIEGPDPPPAVEALAAAVGAADGLVIACPEYVHALPGGFKNAIDWLVPRYEIVGKPIAILHASSRGEEGLTALRRVLGTVSENFHEDIFARFDLRRLSPAAVAAHLDAPAQAARLNDFIDRFLAAIARRPAT